LASEDLLRAMIDPDAAEGNDQVSSTYDRQGQPTGATDQNDTVHAYSYDLLGWLTRSQSTTPA